MLAHLSAQRLRSESVRCSVHVSCTIGVAGKIRAECTLQLHKRIIVYMAISIALKRQCLWLSVAIQGGLVCLRCSLCVELVKTFARIRSWVFVSLQNKVPLTPCHRLAFTTRIPITPCHLLAFTPRVVWKWLLSGYENDELAWGRRQLVFTL